MKKKSSQQIQKYTRDEAKAIALSMEVTGEVGPALKKLTELLPDWRDGKLKNKDEFQKNVSAVMYGYESETHIALLESFSERFRGGIKEICKQFIVDFDCKTNSEKILAETAAVAFGRYMDASRRLNNCLDFNNETFPDKNTYLSMLSKERDRSHRQYLSTISMIKQLKAPNIEMNIKTNTAFVSQNQQFNVPKVPTENNDSK